MSIQGNEEGIMKAELAYPLCHHWPYWQYQDHNSARLAERLVMFGFNLEIIKFTPSLLPLLLAADHKKCRATSTLRTTARALRLQLTCDDKIVHGLDLGKCLFDGKWFTYLGAFNDLVEIRIQTTKTNCICLENFMSGLLVLGSYIRNERFSISRPGNVGDS